MPCYDPETHDAPIRLAKRLNEVTQLLCKTCTQINVHAPDIFVVMPDLYIWWKTHQEHDKHVAYLEAKVKTTGFNSLTRQERDYYYTRNDI